MRASIQDIKEKFNLFITEDVYFYTILIIMISILSFGLGRLSVLEQSVTSQPSVMLTQQPASVVSSISSSTRSDPAVSTTTGDYVASSSGTKYHLTTCLGAKRISEKNKIYFATEEEARASGYTRAKNCKF